MHTKLLKILCFSCQGKTRDIVYQRICLFLWLIFAQHGLFEIQLTVYSALLRLTDLEIYDITRCRIWLLTIFYIPYIHFQRELRKVTSPKWYLSFFVQYTYHTCITWNCCIVYHTFQTTTAFHWSDTSPYIFTAWGKAQPTMKTNAECVVSSNNTWRDVSCDLVLPSLCEIYSGIS